MPDGVQHANLMGEPNFTGEDIADLLRDPAFRAAAYMYAHDLLTENEAAKAYNNHKESAAFEKFTSQPMVMLRIFYDVARRMKGSSSSLGECLSNDKITQLIVSMKSKRQGDFKGGNWGDYFFSEIDNADTYSRAIAPRRDSFTEDDISFVTSSELSLALFDAYGKNIITLGDFCYRLYGDRYAPYPRYLSHWGFLEMAFEIVARIRSGKIKIDDDLIKRYPEAYEPGDPEFLD